MVLIGPMPKLRRTNFDYTCLSILLVSMKSSRLLVCICRQKSVCGCQKRPSKHNACLQKLAKLTIAYNCRSFATTILPSLQLLKPLTMMPMTESSNHQDSCPGHIAIHPQAHVGNQLSSTKVIIWTHPLGFAVLDLSINAVYSMHMYKH